ncbi:Palmitoyl-protein thioesterase 1, partial [Spiromyces aspiralis]
MNNGSLQEVTSDNILKAEVIKAQANKLFGAKKYTEAMEEYTKAIELNPSIPSYYTNRALCHIRLESYGGAILDADKALELDPNLAKAYYRRASAHMALGKFQEAKKDYTEVVRLEPNDKLAKLRLSSCIKLAKQMAFAKALESLTVKQLEADQIDFDNYRIPDDYAGPRMPKRRVASKDGKGEVEEEYIDEGFAQAATEWLRDQKTLPLRYVLWITVQVQRYLRPLPPVIDVSIPNDS